MIRIATAFLASVSLTGCGSAGDSPLVLESDLWMTECGADSVWVQGPDGQTDGAPSLEFLSDGQLQGFTCCNSFFGRYTTQDKELPHGIAITLEGMTLSLCPHSDREQAYIEKLKQARSYAVESGQLRLMDSTGAVTLQFRPASTIQKKNNQTTR